MPVADGDPNLFGEAQDALPAVLGTATLDGIAGGRRA